MKNVATAESLNDWSSIRNNIKCANRAIGILSLIIIATITVLVYTNHILLDANEKLAFFVAITLVPILALDEVRVSVLNGLRLIILSRVMGEFLRSSIVFFVLAVLFCFNLGKIGLDAFNAILIYVCSSAITYIVGLIVLKFVEPNELKLANCNPLKKCQIIYCSFPIALTVLIGVVNQSISTILIGTTLSNIDVGYFRIASLGSGVVLIALTTINNFISPYLSRSYSLNNFDQMQRIAGISAGSALLISLLIAVIYSIFGKTAISKFFGPQYLESYVPLLILAIGQVLSAATGSSSVILYMAGRSKEVLIGATIGAATNVILNIIFVPQYGIIGAAFATALSEVVWSASWSILLWHKLRIVSLPFFLKYTSS